MKKKRLHSCNVLDPASPERRLWHFAVEREEVKLEREEVIAPGAPFPPQLVQKDWRELFHPKLNIAWLPADQVFLRVVQLPAVERQELLSMLEFQLEKISPLPVAQVIWSAEILPSAAENSQTAIVCLASREIVEQFLGSLEERNFQPDRLEVPQLNQILMDGIREDGAWIYPGAGPESDLCTVAWWNRGTLQQLQVLRLPPASSPAEPGADRASRARFLHEQLMQMAWAGELEGWLNLPVQWHLVADESAAAQWQPLLADWAGGGAKLHPAADRAGLARLSASRAARQSSAANLLPSEFAARYHQRYIDRLWMRGLGAVVVCYVAGVMVYMLALQILSFRHGRLQSQIASISGAYTNVLQLKERVQVLQDQLNLKYAALDCWKVVSELLPADFTLILLQFTRGRAVELQGTAPPGQEKKVLEYSDELRKATVNGRNFFREVTTPTTFTRGSPTLQWNFRAELNLSEAAE